MKQQSINSLAIALFLSANPIAWIFSFLPSAIVFVVAFSWLIVILNRQIISIFKSPLYVHLSVMTLTVFLLFSLNRNYTAITIEYFSFFIVTGITGIYFSQLNFSIKKILKYISLIAIPLSIYIFKLDVGSFEEGTVDYGYLMGISYGILRFIIALMTLLFFYNKEYSKFHISVFFISLLLFLSFYLKFATRGAMLAIFVYLVIYYIIKSEKTKKTIMRLSLVATLAIISIIFFSNIIIFTNRQLKQIGVEIEALTKTETFLEIGKSIDNGRGNIAIKAINDIYSAPLTGYGVAGFEKKYNTNYIHNVFLQAMYEGGIIYFSIFILIFSISLITLFKSKVSIETRVFILFLLTAGMMELLFSNVYWRSQFFWFYIFFILGLMPKIRFIPHKNEK